MIQALASGTALAAPSVDRHGWVWTARRLTAAPLVVARPGGPALQLGQAFIDGRQVAVRVDVGVAVAGEVLDAGGHAARLDAVDLRHDVAGDERLVAAERPHAPVARARLLAGDAGMAVQQRDHGGVRARVAHDVRQRLLRDPHDGRALIGAELLNARVDVGQHWLTGLPGFVDDPLEHPTRVVTVSMTAAARNRIATKAKRSRPATAASSARAAVPNTRDRSVVGVEHQHHLRFGETGDQEQRVV